MKLLETFFEDKKPLKEEKNPHGGSSSFELYFIQEDGDIVLLDKTEYNKDWFYFIEPIVELMKKAVEFGQKHNVDPKRRAFIIMTDGHSPKQRGIHDGSSIEKYLDSIPAALRSWKRSRGYKIGRQMLKNKKMGLSEAFINMDLLAQLQRIERSLEIDPDDKKVLNDLAKISKETGIPMKNQRDVQKVIYFFLNQEQVY